MGDRMKLVGFINIWKWNIMIQLIKQPVKSIEQIKKADAFIVKHSSGTLISQETCIIILNLKVLTVKNGLDSRLISNLFVHMDWPYF